VDARLRPFSFAIEMKLSTLASASAKLRWTAAAASANLGWIAAAHYAVQRVRLQAAPDHAQLPLYSKHARHPLYARAGTSDLDVYEQVFLWREYQCLDAVREAPLIVDCGANVGFSAAYFLSRFPAASVIAVEPDPGNFAQMERNLAPYGARVVALRTGIWSHPARLVMSSDSWGDDREWARTVREARPDEPGGMEALDIATLLARSGERRIAILKVDIEGAERVVFGAPCPWLRDVDNIVIELHGRDCEAIFHRAIAGAGFAVSQSKVGGDLTVCSRNAACAVGID
jgi:FkbM family methyltransferase